jgi:hypothetical protein
MFVATVSKILSRPLSFIIIIPSTVLKLHSIFYVQIKNILQPMQKLKNEEHY